MARMNWNRPIHRGKGIDSKSEGIEATKWIRNALKAKKVAEDAILDRRLREKIARYKKRREEELSNQSPISSCEEADHTS